MSSLTRLVLNITQIEHIDFAGMNTAFTITREARHDERMASFLAQLPDFNIQTYEIRIIAYLSPNFVETLGSTPYRITRFQIGVEAFPSGINAMEIFNQKWPPVVCW
jgi:hypothetical protein